MSAADPFALASAEADALKLARAIWLALQRELPPSAASVLREALSAYAYMNPNADFRAAAQPEGEG